jgi:hypothetical protein
LSTVVSEVRTASSIRDDDTQQYNPEDSSEQEKKVYKVLVGKPEGKIPLGRPRRRWEDGVRMDLREIGLGGVDWIRLAQNRDR